MTTKLNLFKAILQPLAHLPYVMIEPISLSGFQQHASLLMSKKDLKTILPNLRALADIQSIRLISDYKSTEAVLDLEQGATLIIRFVHKLAHRSLVYYDESKMLNQRVQTSEGYYIPCVEHLFEQIVLHDFLNMRGIGKEAFKYFSEFHILVKEDLIDQFNVRYGTSFSSLYQLTDFDSRQRDQMIKKLKTLPLNGLLTSVKHTFLSYVKQAKIF